MTVALGGMAAVMLIPARTTKLRRRLGRWQLDDDTQVRSARTCVPYLAAHGMLHGPWLALLGDGPVLGVQRPRERRCDRRVDGLACAGASPLRIVDGVTRSRNASCYGSSPGCRDRWGRARGGQMSPTRCTRTSRARSTVGRTRCVGRSGSSRQP